MKKLCFFAITVFALAGLLFLIGCSTGNDDNVRGDIINKTALQEKIAEAKAERVGIVIANNSYQFERVPLGKFWVTETVMTTFDSAIATAERTVASNVSQAAVDTAVTALNYALTIFKNARKPGTADPVDTAALNAKIAKAESERLIVIINTTATNVAQGAYWVISAIMTTFNNAINAAKTAFNESETTQPELNQAESTMDSAISVFISSRQIGSKTSGFTAEEMTALIARANTVKTGVKTSTTNGDDIGPAEFWVAQDSLDTLNSVITQAQSATGNIDTAYLALVTAINTFNEAKKLGTLPNKTALFNAIRSADVAKDGVVVAANASQAPKDMSWATTAQWAPFNTAYNNALAAASNANTTTNAVNAALSNLSAATSEFSQALEINGPGTKQNSIMITGFNGPAFTNDTLITVGLFFSMDNFDYTAPQIIGWETIQDGVATAKLYESSSENPPWAGTGSWYVFLRVDWQFPIYISKTTINFTATPNASIPFSNFKKYAFSAKLGELNDWIFDSPGQTMSLDQWFNLIGETSYNSYLENDGGKFYKNETLTQPFSGSDTVTANTVIYSESPLPYNQNNRGEKIGEITGTITLTGISNPPPRVYINAEGGNDYNTWRSDSEINMGTVTGQNAPLNWSIPIYENYYFVSGITHFNLWIQPSGSNNGISIPIPGSKDIVTPNDNVGELGTVSIAFITLSGTINVRYNDNPVPKVEIATYIQNQGFTTMLSSPGGGAAWSIIMPVLATPENIFFEIKGYTNDLDFLFNKNFYPSPPISVSDQDIGGIQIDLGEANPFNPVNEIPLTNRQWADGNLNNTNSVDWYSIQMSTGQDYYIWWNDSDNSDGDKTADIQITAYSDSGELIFAEDNGWNSPERIRPHTSGKVYLRVDPRGAHTGTYGVVYSTGGMRPGSWTTPSNATPLVNGQWVNGNLTYTLNENEAWYSIQASVGQDYYFWWNDIDNDSGTLDIKVAAYYSNGSEIFDVDNSDRNSESFNSNSAGTVYVRVYPLRSDTGTYGIVYSTSSSMPMP
jgi:hypothetical protein